MKGPSLVVLVCMAVDGTYAGSAGQGTWTLMASGVLLASGTYVCNDAGCTFTGK